jgi:hypothetical protein
MMATPSLSRLENYGKRHGEISIVIASADHMDDDGWWQAEPLQISASPRPPHLQTPNQQSAASA